MAVVDVLFQIAATDLTQIIAKTLNNRLNKAKEDYQVEPKDISSPTEITRSRLLGILSELQTKIMLYISKQTELIRLLAILADQTIQVYEAKTEQELKLVELSLGQIEGFLKRYEKIARQRIIARTSAIIVSFVAIIGLVIIMYFASYTGNLNSTTVLPVIQLPLPILIWSAIGSFASILYRFNKSGDIELQDPLRWLFARPLTGIVMGIVSYFMLLIGFLAVGSKDISSFNSSVVFWLVAFISGFSDRFADGLLKSLVGRFGGDEQADLVSLDSVSSYNSSPLASFFEGLPVVSDWIKKHESETKTLVDTTSSSTKAAGAVLSQTTSVVASNNLIQDQTSSTTATPVVKDDAH